MMLSTKQALLNYLGFLKENGFLYMEGMESASASVAAPSRTTPTPAAAGPAPTTTPASRKPVPPAAPHPDETPGTAAASVATPLSPATPVSTAHPKSPDWAQLEAGVSLPREKRIALLEDGRARAEACRACALGAQRHKLVYSDGDPEARIMFVGEAPGGEEDATGLPFVGRAGQLLNKMIAAIGFKREEVFICNTLKCRPPGNRDPFPTEKAACEHFLIEQIRIVRPRILVALGAHAAQYLCRSKAGIGQLRGRWHRYEDVPLLATFHPSFLLHKEREAGYLDFKRKSWEDFQMIHAKYTELAPEDPRKIWTKGESKG